MVFHSCQAIHGATDGPPYFTTLSLPRSRPHTHFQSAGFRSVLPDNNQSSCQNALMVRHDIPASYRHVQFKESRKSQKGGAIAPQSLLRRPISGYRTPRSLSDIDRLRRTMPRHLLCSRPRKILTAFQRIRLRFFGACGRASACPSFAS